MTDEHPRVGELHWRGKKLFHDGMLVAQIGIHDSSRFAVCMAYGYTVVVGFDLKSAKRRAALLSLHVLNFSQEQREATQRPGYVHDASTMWQ